MSDMTVGPIQTYTSESTVSLPTTNLNPVQGSVSVTLTDSNLWLVDTTKLKGQTGDPASQFTLLDLQTKYQTTVPFENVNFDAATIAPAALTSSESAYLQTTLPQGNSLLLATVTGGTQLGSDGISLTSAGSSGGDTGGLSASGSSGGLSNGNSGGGSGAGGGGGAGSSGSSGAGSSSSSASPDGQTTQTAATNTQSTANPQATISPQPTGSPQAPVPVPFEVSPTIGLLLVLVIFGYKRLLSRTALKPIGVSVTSLFFR